MGFGFRVSGLGRRRLGLAMCFFSRGALKTGLKNCREGFDRGFEGGYMCIKSRVWGVGL